MVCILPRQADNHSVDPELTPLAKQQLQGSLPPGRCLQNEIKIKLNYRTKISSTTKGQQDLHSIDAHSAEAAPCASSEQQQV